jgi:hypothetical protein
MEEIRSLEDLGQLLESIDPSNYAQTLFRDRLYDGQPHTDTGERGRQEVHGVTMRDLRDCFIRGCYESSGLAPSEYPSTVYKLPWDQMDPMAVIQNMLCNVEKLMGIYPNLPKLERAEGTDE